MTKKYYINYLLIITLICVGIFACVKKTNYPVEPVISFNSFTPYQDETADINIKFTDGDGDIGVDITDSKLTMWVNYYYKDTITQIYRAFCYGCGTDSLKNPYIVRAPKDSYLGKPISGEIVVNLQGYRHSKKIKYIKYVIYLFDKAGNKSNVITTPELIVP